ncbi:NAD(P)-dependent oxidoreductase [Paenibacillus sp. M1]|uniref:NAD(P)-dependent oxidoreductase n=1 Tax=Paenibacillus haidiansis TaxID=1574488 RepID=A0ABU7VVZ7_9BACL
MDERKKKLRGKVILITGAGGFTGVHACRYFSSIGMRVAAVVRDASSDREVSGAKYHSCDLLAPEQVKAVVKEIAPDYVLHLGGKNSVPESWDNPLLYMESNVLSLLYLLDALRAFPACRALIVGSRLSFRPGASFYRPHHPYGLSKSLQKIAALSWKELFGQDVMLAEPSNLIGPGRSTGFCSLLGRRIVREERGEGDSPFRVSSRDERRDFLDVRDAVRAYGFLLAKGNCGEVYQVCSGEEQTLEEVTMTMLQLAGSNLPVEWGENRSADSVVDCLKPEFLTGIGWAPRIPLKSSLEDVIRYYRTAKGGI